MGPKTMAEHLNFCYTPLFFRFICEFQVKAGKCLFNYLLNLYMHFSGEIHYGVPAIEHRART